VAGAAQGNLDYLIPGLAGFLAGAVLWGATYSTVFPQISAFANVGAVTLPALFDLNTWLVVFLFVEMCLFLFWILEKVGQVRKDKLAAAVGMEVDMEVSK
jgi:uncharacterized protein